MDQKLFKLSWAACHCVDDWRHLHEIGTGTNYVHDSLHLRFTSYFIRHSRSACNWPIHPTPASYRHIVAAIHRRCNHVAALIPDGSSLMATKTTRQAAVQPVLALGVLGSSGAGPSPPRLSLLLRVRFHKSTCPGVNECRDTVFALAYRPTWTGYKYTGCEANLSTPPRLVVKWLG